MTVLFIILTFYVIVLLFIAKQVKRETDKIKKENNVTAFSSVDAIIDRALSGTDMDNPEDYGYSTTR
jgi:Na+-transporting methylmalonyl-CoA/oxaloacetate decarboxylase gamma subunit